MIELNNCTTCGRKPRIGINGWSSDVWCRCGKIVKSNGGIWSEEVAADMWNRANPQEEKTMHSDYINYLADRLAKNGIRVIVQNYGFSFDTKRGVAEKNIDLMNEALNHGDELTEFYKNRLKPGAIA